MMLKADWLASPEVQAITALMERAGYKALFVGGAVRNALLGLPVSDLDIATDALPETVMALAEAEGHRVVPTGLKHGTVTVVIRAESFEVTSFRKDITTDGRHAEVVFGTSIEDDARRRDFTINALYADARGDVFDPVGGLEDIEARRVRFVGDAGQRCREDYLRILRFFRFTAWYGDPSLGVDAEGLAACAEEADGLARISAERIGAEICKLLAAQEPWPALAAMEASGVLLRVLPGASLEVAQVADGFAEAPDPMARLAWMGGENVAERFRLSRAEAKRVAALRDAMSSALAAGALGYRLGESDGWFAHVGRALSMGGAPTKQDKEALLKGASSDFPLRAADLAPLQGAALGARLKALEEAWIESDFSLSGPELLALP